MHTAIKHTKLWPYFGMQKFSCDSAAQFSQIESGIKIMKIKFKYFKDETYYSAINFVEFK